MKECYGKNSKGEDCGLIETTPTVWESLKDVKKANLSQPLVPGICPDCRARRDREKREKDNV